MAVPEISRLLEIIDLQNEIASARFGVDHVLERVTERACALTGASGGAVHMVDGDEFLIRAVSGSSGPSLRRRSPREGTFAGLCIEQRVPLSSPDASTDPRLDGAASVAAGIASMICVPLVHDGDAVGVLAVTGSVPRSFAQEDVDTLRLLAQIIATSLHHEAEQEAAMHESLHDTLTGLGNRRMLDTAIAAEIERYRRYGHPFSLALLDLGEFDQVGDRWGAAVADEALKQIAAILRSVMRANDCCSRFRGDEFAVLMPNTDMNGAQLALGRLERAVSQARIAQGAVEVTGGIASAERKDETPAEIVGRADTSLYEAKRLR